MKSFTFFDFLKKQEQAGEKYDLIILDNINSNKVEIFSLEGTKIMEIPSLGLNKVEINISNLSPSVYFARTDNKTMKFVVIK